MAKQAQRWSWVGVPRFERMMAGAPTVIMQASLNGDYSAAYTDTVAVRELGHALGLDTVSRASR